MGKPFVLSEDAIAKMVFESASGRILDQTGFNEQGVQWATTKCGCEAIVIQTCDHGPVLGWVGCDLHVYDENGNLNVSRKAE